MKDLQSTRDMLPEVMTTNEAAPFINRKPQTLRKWACLENGPIRPIRIHGRLAWRVADLLTLLTGTASRVTLLDHIADREKEAGHV